MSFRQQEEGDLDEDSGLLDVFARFFGFFLLVFVVEKPEIVEVIVDNLSAFHVHGVDGIGQQNQEAKEMWF